MSRVKNVTSPRLILGFTAVSVLAGLAGAFFWETVTLSGTLFWNINTNPVRARRGNGTQIDRYYVCIRNTR